MEFDGAKVFVSNENWRIWFDEDENINCRHVANSIVFRLKTLTE